MGQVLQCSLLPEHNEEKSVTDFILTDFIDAVRAFLRRKVLPRLKTMRKVVESFWLDTRADFLE